MEYNDVYNTISRKIEKYVYVSEGKKHEIRLFISVNNDICFAIKGSRKYGYMLSVSEMDKWDSLTKVNKGNKTDLVKRMRKRAESGIEMLNESGLWLDIKKELMKFIDLSDDDIRRDFIDGDIYETYRTKKYDWLKSYQVFFALKAKNVGKILHLVSMISVRIISSIPLNVLLVKRSLSDLLGETYMTIR